jgi:hypothetical protein
MSSERESTPLTCSSEELYTFVSSSNRSWLMLSLSNPRVTEEHVLALLRNPHITQELLQSIHERFSKSYRIQFGIANCPKTPYPLAMRLIQTLFWNDLVKISENFRLFPPLRRTAENYLRDKISGLTVGEKKTLARTAPRSLIGQLKTETEPAVFECLLQNPRLIEEDLLQVLHHELTPGAILEKIAANRQWTARYPVRLALARSAKIPLRIRLSLLSKLHKSDLEHLAKDDQNPDLVRMAAERILDGRY